MRASAPEAPGTWRADRRPRLGCIRWRYSARPRLPDTHLAALELPGTVATLAVLQLLRLRSSGRERELATVSGRSRWELGDRLEDRLQRGAEDWRPGEVRAVAELVLALRASPCA